MSRFLKVGAGLLVLLALPGTAIAGISKCVGANGKVTFSDKPCAADQQASKVNSFNSYFTGAQEVIMPADTYPGAEIEGEPQIARPKKADPELEAHIKKNSQFSGRKVINGNPSYHVSVMLDYRVPSAESFRVSILLYTEVQQAMESVTAAIERMPWTQELRGVGSRAFVTDSEHGRSVSFCVGNAVVKVIGPLPESIEFARTYARWLSRKS